MPIFFNLESHLWIAYLLFFNGYLAQVILRTWSIEYARLTHTFEAQVLGAFFISVGFNGLALLLLQLWGQPFAVMKGLLPIISLSLLITVWRKTPSIAAAFNFELHWARLLLYSFVFVILFINGGLIEQISDAWWHMSLANKIALESSYELSAGHLTGMPTRYYPPLWHGNLALLKVLSGEPLVVLWNSFTAWGASIKVMAFFLFALALTKNKLTALFAALLFVLLPGVGNAYLRVSAWPSHIAYAAWFVCLALAVQFFDASGRASSWRNWFSLDSGVQIGVGLALALAIYFSHKAELLWFALAMYFYWLALLIRRAWCGEQYVSRVEPAFLLLSVFGVLLTCGWLFLSASRVIEGYADGSWDERIALVLSPALTLVLLFVAFVGKPAGQGWRRLLTLGIVAIAAVSIDTQHALSLFNPDLAYPIKADRQWALSAPGWFGGALKIPGWHLQLREGLLYSGVLALPLSILLTWYWPSRTTIMLAGNCCFVLLICLSPYFYHGFYELLDYHSPWRISVLVWHPIVFAFLITKLIHAVRQSQ